MGLRLRVVGQRCLIAEDGAGIDAHVAADVAVAPENRIMDARFTADATIGPDDGPADDRILFDLSLPSNHRVWTNPGARLDKRPFIDEAGAFNRRAFLNADIG